MQVNEKRKTSAMPLHFGQVEATPLVVASCTQPCTKVEHKEAQQDIFIYGVFTTHARYTLSYAHRGHCLNQRYSYRTLPRMRKVSWGIEEVVTLLLVVSKYFTGVKLL